LDAKIEQMMQDIVGAFDGINTALTGINAKLHKVLKGQMGENGVLLRSLQFNTQRELEKLVKRVDMITESGPTALHRISSGIYIDSHEYLYNVHPQNCPQYPSYQLLYNHQPYPPYHPYPPSYPHPSYTYPIPPPGSRP
jgi:hypothetical protein